MAHEPYESLAALEAIGATTAEESESLRAHLSGCDECQQAYDEYVEAAAAMGRSVTPAAPPPEVRQRILNTISREEEGGAEVVEIASARRTNAWWLASAATFFLALWGWREIGIRVARERLGSQLAEIQQLQDENATLREQKNKVIEALASRSTRTIALAGQQIAPAASARVFLHPESRRAVVFFYDLPANPSDKSYELWLIRSDQAKPENVGVFDVSPTGTASVTLENLPVDTTIKALAVTMEPRGGVAQPTNANYYVVGNT